MVSITQFAPRAAQLNGAAPASVIEVRGLRKSYGSIEAVRGIDLTVSAGEIARVMIRVGPGEPERGLFAPRFLLAGVIVLLVIALAYRILRRRRRP